MKSSLYSVLKRSSIIFLTGTGKRAFATDTTYNMAPRTLNDWAKEAIAKADVEFKDLPKLVDPNSNDNTGNLYSISVAKSFLAKASPKFLDSSMSSDDDRLVKVGRSVSDLVHMADEASSSDNLTHGLSHVVEQCDILAMDDWKVPKVRFGKTELQMPIVTLGCMRFQQTWGGNLKTIDEVKKEQQANLVKILKHAITNLGINHIENARMYGSSELQMGVALKEIFETGVAKREDLIIQTKVGAMNAKNFRETLEKSFSFLQLDYFDLFSFHGICMDRDYDLIFNNPSGEENLIDIVKEYQKAGKIKHIGFSTHGQPEQIRRFIETGQFEYANIHYHAFGSYTASGGGKLGSNKETIRLMKKYDMGTFIISPYDKGGRLYAPSRKLRSLTLPDLEPIQYGSLWLFNHEELDEEGAPAHTIVCGAARPSDLDEPAIAAYLHGTRKEENLTKVRAVQKRLYDAEVEALGEEWVNTWHQGLPNSVTLKDPYQFGQMVWQYNIIKAWGLLDYSRERYSTFDGNLKAWDFDKPANENIQKIGAWPYMPGIAFEPGKDYSKYLENVPEENKAKVLEALEFVHKFSSNTIDRSCLEVPKEWETAYDMRPWTAFPEQK